MTYSMTGYGRGAATTGNCTVIAEIRTVNARHLKLHTRLPAGMGASEGPVESLIKERLGRGTVNTAVEVVSSLPLDRAGLDRVALREYARELRRLRDELDIDAPITFEALFALPGVLAADRANDGKAADLGPATLAAVAEALDRLTAMRAKEGDALVTDIKQAIHTAESLIQRIEARLPQALAEQKLRLSDRLQQFLERAGTPVSDADIAREIIFYVERSDIAEELARVRSHISQFVDTLADCAPVGRRLEFLAQELHRETNTMGAKVSDTMLSKIIIDLKEQIDKIREQVLNLE